MNEAARKWRAVVDRYLADMWKRLERVLIE